MSGRSSSASTERGPGRMNPDKKRRKKIAVDPSPFELEGELLNGIPNEITLNHITTQIANPLKNFPILSSVSPVWRQAMRHGFVNRERVRLQSAETFIVVLKYDRRANSYAINLFSMQRRNWSRLPAIPRVERWEPSSCECQCVALAGKIYVLGGGPTIGSPASQEVYMWDLAGQGQWKQCAQMREGRMKFGCAVLNGKIYVFGGSASHQEIVRGSEVYDPNQDAWSPIRPIKVINQFHHTVTAVGEELYVYGGKVYDRYHNLKKDAHGLKAYDPVQDKWTILLSNNLRREYEVAAGFFVAQGKILSISLPQSRVDVYDLASKSWTQLHTFSLADIERRHSTRTQAYRVKSIERVLLVDNELLALVNGSNRDLLLHSRGFNSGHTKISWEDVSRPLTSRRDFGDRIICSVQL